MDKVYQGLVESLLAIHSENKSPNSNLSLDNNRRNENVSGDRVVIENFFRRMATFWMVIRSKWRWRKKNYDIFYNLSVVLTNAQILFHALRENYGGLYRQYKSRLLSIGNKIVRKMRRSQAKSRERRRARVEWDMGTGRRG